MPGWKKFNIIILWKDGAVFAESECSKRYGDSVSPNQHRWWGNVTIAEVLRKTFLADNIGVLVDSASEADKGCGCETGQVFFLDPFRNRNDLDISVELEFEVESILGSRMFVGSLLDSKLKKGYSILSVNCPKME